MPLKLIPPGKRRNRFWLARGRVNGRLYEVTTGKTNKSDAEKARARIELDILEDRANPDTITFAQAAKMYSAFRNPPKESQQRIDRLVAAIGRKTLAEIQHKDLVEAADLLYPNCKASSRNRSVIAPAAAILHYAAENKLCEYRRIKRFKEATPVTRALSQEAANALIAAADGDVKTLLLWLFHQGTRISDALRVKWDDVDLKKRTVRLRISKTDEWRTFPLAETVFFRLANESRRGGYLFPWRNRWAAYGALEPVLKATGIKFTPHMARHSLGTWLNASGAGLRTIMGALGHKDAKSSMRYQDADVEIIRSAVVMAVGKSGKRKSKQ